MFFFDSNSSFRRSRKEGLHLLKLFCRFYNHPVLIVGDDVCLGQFRDVDVMEQHHCLFDLLVVKFRYLGAVFPFDDLVAEIPESQCPILSEKQIEDCTTVAVRK